MIFAKQSWKFIQLQIVPALAKMESELDQIWYYYDISQPVLAEKLEALPRWNQHKKVLGGISGLLREGATANQLSASGGVALIP
jgi:hypothetical protein